MFYIAFVKDMAWVRASARRALILLYKVVSFVAPRDAGDVPAPPDGDVARAVPDIPGARAPAPALLGLNY